MPASLESLVDQYAQERDVADDTAKWLRYIARWYGDWIGHAATVADLTDERINAWTADMLGKGRARRTVRSYRGGLVMIWRYAVEIGTIDDLPKRLRKIRVPKLVPCAWTADEVSRLLSQAVAMGGFYRCGVRRSSYWVALILVLWDTGMRIGDVLRLERGHIGADGTGCLNQRKTGWPLVFKLSPRTLEAIGGVVQDERERVFGGVVSRKWVFVQFRRMATNAGLSGGTKKIRKSGATAVEKLTPGAAMGYLGHRTPGLAYQHYVDPRLLGGGGQSTPPPLAG